MAGYILSFRDEESREELVEKMHKAKKAICEAVDALEEAEEEDGGRYNERDYSPRYRGGMRYRDEAPQDRSMMNRHGNGRYDY